MYPLFMGTLSCPYFGMLSLFCSKLALELFFSRNGIEAGVRKVGCEICFVADAMHLELSVELIEALLSGACIANLATG